MSLFIDKLAVGYAPRTEGGDKLEPEEQAVTQIGRMPIHVNMGTADLEHKNGGAPIITQRNVGHLHQMGVLKRTTSVVQAERMATVRCDHCKEFDHDAIHSSQRNQFAVQSQLWIIKCLKDAGRDPSEAAQYGHCRHLDSFVAPYQYCADWKPHSLLRRALGAFRTSIMRAASGK